MTRESDHVDRKIGAAIRLARRKQGISQTTLGKAIGVTFQQIQKYEKGTNAVSTTRLPALCRLLKITPNDLYGIAEDSSAEVPKLKSWAVDVALELQELPPRQRRAIEAVIRSMRNSPK